MISLPVIRRIITREELDFWIEHQKLSLRKELLSKKASMLDCAYYDYVTKVFEEISGNCIDGQYVQYVCNA